MSAPLTIGDFSRATFLGVKTLRHYHRVGILEPADVDPVTGYRRYSADQIPTAQVIRRFRDLHMPLEEIGMVLRAPDGADRNRMIAAHLARLERRLTETQQVVASLRDLLEHDPPDATIEHRSMPSIPAAVVVDIVDVADLPAWFEGAFGEIRATLAAQGIANAGLPGGVYANELFAEERGASTVYLPTDRPVRPVGRVRPLVVPPAELAVITHTGAHTDVDRSYGALATYVSEHALAVDGPVREYYPVSRYDTDDEQAWRTDIGWPIFDVLGQGSPRGPSPAPPDRQ